MDNLKKKYHLTKEYIDFFKKRTNKHIQSVQTECKKILDGYMSSLFSEDQKIILLNNISQHDNSKFSDINEYHGYVLLTYYKKNNMEIPNELNSLIQKVTYYHVKNNKHHPEYWDNDITINCINLKDRDKPSNQITDATKMDKISITEMCCDWTAASNEFNKNVIEWADSNINKRWLFNENQIVYIYMILKFLKSKK